MQAVNNQTAYNWNGTIDAIPIVAYHSIGEETTSSYNTDLALFAEEMKYLHDNGFKIIRVPDLGYDDKTKDLYIKRWGSWNKLISIKNVRLEWIEHHIK